jgi:saccharopine dehydrogenase-like NADP-dependent oxidoreductase
MKKILILGAGLSTNSLIEYLLNIAVDNNWHITVADMNLDTARSKVRDHQCGSAISFNISDTVSTNATISESDVVISMLPASMHTMVASACIKYKKPMLTASYASDDIKAFDAAAKEAGIPIYMELGLDPGIDHMSAMKAINRIKEGGGELTSFYSFTGGLVAPEYDNNPWNYKFTWNPRNVVMAGNGVSQYIHGGRYKYIPYHRLFDRTISRKILSYGDFEVYPNRDSLKYRSIYNLEDIPSMYRGTVRRPGYAKAWSVFVSLGMTDDSYTLEESEKMTYRQFINTFLRYEPNVPVEIKLRDYCQAASDPIVMQKLQWLGIFDDRRIGLKNATPAQILEKLLIEKWSIDPEDKDMIIMQHEFKYKLDGIEKMIVSAMAFTGRSQTDTAMAITVGLPLGIATKLFINGNFSHTGVVLPTGKDMYEPILDELETFGITFEENDYLIG